MTKKLDKRNVLVIGDTHFPFEQKGYLEFCLKIKKEHNCGTIVHIGDLCFKPDCEIMTQDGFIRFDKLQASDSVMQVNSFGKGNLTQPIRIINKHYSGDMIRHIGKSYDIEATKGHNIVYYHKKNSFKKIPIEKLKKSAYYRIPRTIQYDGNGVDFTDDEIRLQVAIRADFSISQKGIGFRASFKKKRKQKRIVELLDKLNIKYSITDDSKNSYKKVFIHSSEYVKKFTKDLRLDWVTKLSNNQIKIYIDELKYWDGYDDRLKHRIVFSTKHDDEAKFIQTISHLIGIQSTITVNNTGQKRVNILLNKKDTRTTYLKTYIEWYEGNVYCVTVPTGMILVRQNGNISVVGNCDNHAISYHEHDPDLWSPEDEMKKVDSILKKWFKAFPQLYLCRGNHDNLIDRKGKTVGLPKRCFKPFREIWNLPKGWKDDFNFIIDKVLYTHGTGNSGKLAHLNLALHNRISTVIGHSHAFAGIAFTASPRDCIFGMNVGSAVNNSALAFAYGKDLKNKPIVSCGIVFNGEDPCIFRMRL